MNVRPEMCHFGSMLIIMKLWFAYFQKFIGNHYLHPVCITPFILSTTDAHANPWTEVNSIPLGQNGRHFAKDIFSCIFVNEKIFILIKMSLKFVPKGLIGSNPARVPSLFCGYFTSNASIHKYETWQALHFHLPQVRSDLGKKNIR